MKLKIKDIIFIIGLFGLDILSKQLIQNNIEIGQSIPIIEGFFDITYVKNTGAAWSILEGKMLFFYLITIIGLIFMIYLLKNIKDNIIEKYAIFMMLAGTIGNLYDRIVYQYVRDFLDFIIFGYDFPVFNLADSFLCIGVFILIISTLYDEYKMK